jgi:hypothetical protein
MSSNKEKEKERGDHVKGQKKGKRRKEENNRRKRGKRRGRRI